MNSSPTTEVNTCTPMYMGAPQHPHAPIDALYRQCHVRPLFFLGRSSSASWSLGGFIPASGILVCVTIRCTTVSHIASLTPFALLSCSRSVSTSCSSSVTLVFRESGSEIFPPQLSAPYGCRKKVWSRRNSSFE